MKANSRLTNTFVALSLLTAFLQPERPQEDIPALVKKIQSGVVMILTYDEKGEELGQGSGFFISENGDVITNRHVLEGSNRALVKASDGKVYPVRKIVAEDKDNNTHNRVPSTDLQSLYMRRC